MGPASQLTPSYRSHVMGGDHTCAAQTVAADSCNIYYPSYPTTTPSYIPCVVPSPSPQAGLLALVRALLTAVENKTISEETMKRVLDLLDKG